MMKVRRTTRTFCVTLLLLAILGVFGVAAQTGSTYFISDVDSSSFPLVQFKLRAVDLENKVVSGLDAPNVLSVYENGQQAGDVLVTPKSDGPINYIFMIDLGRISNYRQFQLSNIRQVISTLVSGGYFVDGQDSVMVLGRQNINSDQTVTLLPATQTGSELTTWAANFNFDRSSGNTKGLLGVEDAIQEMGELVPIPGSETAAVIFITRYIEDPSATVAPTSAQNTADQAREENISIHVLQTDTNQYRKDALEVLANGSYGQYAGLNRSNFLGQITSIYQAIDSQRTYYDVSYRSPIAETEHHELTINSPVRPDEGVYGSYDITLQLPTVSITQPIANSTIRREAQEETDASQPIFDTSRVPVVAQVNWVDGFPRQIETAELYVNGNLEDSILAEPDQTDFEFQWDLSDITTAGILSVTLEVRIQDELGMEADAQTSVNVEVILPDESSGIKVTPLIASLSAFTVCLGGLVILVVIVGVVFLIRRSSASQPGVAADAVELQPTMMGDDVQGLSLATLVLLEGSSGLKDEVFKITTLRTTLGRDPSKTDISFYSDEESSVSRVHCIIVLDDDNVFRLIDKNSSSGTRLNGRQIKPEVAVDLAEGDEIVLGNLAQKGVKLRFHYLSGDDDVQLSGNADDRTHLLSDEDARNWDEMLDNSS